MPEFYTWTILLITQQDEIDEKQLSFFGSRGGQISPLMHVPLCFKPLCILMNRSFDDRIFPDIWKIANAIPIFKKRDKS